MSRPDPSTTATASRLRALRGNSFGAVVMLLVQYSLGIWVNLYARLPASDRGQGLLGAVGVAITGGPLALSLHAILGIGLLAAGLAALVRTVIMRTPAWIAVALLALLALVFAAVNGSRFVGGGSDDASLGMALATAVALLCYAIILFAVTPRQA